MKVLALDIAGFRGIGTCHLVFPDQVAIVGPNGSGKSTIVDALSLVFGRQKLVRDLTEHDFTGSKPQPIDRIKIVATPGGFSPNDPERHTQWFQARRAVEKWWNPATQKVDPVRPDGGELCVQIGYAARFDHEDLEVKQIRYFHDDDDLDDPYVEDAVTRFPDRLLREIGFYVLPARRTWPSTISFGSELFRRAVATLGGVPASSVLEQLNKLRTPDHALENDPELSPLITRINSRMAKLIPGNPRLQLRVTSTDSDSLLRSLVPHYLRDNEPSLPASRHGTGLVSLQSLVLLLEIGRARKELGESFILALEEPELHLQPGIQRRLIGDAVAASNQVVCTTHSPRVAAFFEAGDIQILTRSLSESAEEEGTPGRRFEGKPLAPSSMINEPNALVQLYTDARTSLVEALMSPRVLVPEGRTDYEWLRLLLDVAETGVRLLNEAEDHVPPFGAVIGVVPTRDSHVRITLNRLCNLHPAVFALVDGDEAGDDYVSALLTCEPTPTAIFQWPNGWAIEDVVGWAIAADEVKILAALEERLGERYASLDALTQSLRTESAKDGGLKYHYIAHEEIAGAMKRSLLCVQRVENILEALTRVGLGRIEEFEHLEVDESRSIDSCKVCRLRI
ncbi:MAG: AAA family ATPase [bacterium]|nr:AAA family ATPase [bacterium]